MDKYKAICEKLGFDPIKRERKTKNFENDSEVNPYSILTIEELNFLINYMRENKKGLITND